MKLLLKQELDKLQNIKIIDVSNREKLFFKEDFIEYVKTQYKNLIPKEKQEYHPNIDFGDLNINNVKLNILIKLLNINILEINIKNFEQNINSIKEKINVFLKNNLSKNDDFKNLKFSKENEKNRKNILIDDKILDIYDVESIRHNVFNKKSPLILRNNNIIIDNKKYNFDIVIKENFDIILDYIKVSNILNLDSSLNIN